MRLSLPSGVVTGVLTGGNHLATALLGRIGPAALDDIRHGDYATVLARHGQPVADIWAAWRPIMDLRDEVDRNA